jgi:hypothetical protein
MAEEKPFLTIDLLDEEAKKQVIECVQKRGKLTIFAQPKGSVAHAPGTNGFTRID